MALKLKAMKGHLRRPKAGKRATPAELSGSAKKALAEFMNSSETHNSDFNPAVDSEPKMPKKQEMVSKQVYEDTDDYNVVPISDTELKQSQILNASQKGGDNVRK